MRTVILHGRLRREFGGPYKLEVSSAAEAIRALVQMRDGFAAAMREGYYRIVRGDLKQGLDIAVNNLNMKLGEADLHIVPVPAGSKRGGVGKIILGVAIAGMAIALAPATGGATLAGGVNVITGGLGATAFAGITYGQIALFGAAMALGGVATMLAPAPKIGNLENTDQRASYLFNGPVNVSEQGNPVPLIYGRVRAGSVVISSGLNTEDMTMLQTQSDGSGSGVTIGGGTLGEWQSVRA